jgi:coenzyme PQQ synthesis protein D (PqqD)
MTEASFRRASAVVARRIAGETVLVPIAEGSSDPRNKTADLYVLNSTGEFLWSLLEEPRDIKSLAQNLNLTFGVAPERAEADVTAFVADLVAIGALEGVTG